MGQNKWRYRKKIYIWNRMRLSLKGKKIIVNQLLFSKLWYIGNIYTKNIQVALEQKKYNLPDT